MSNTHCLSSQLTLLNDHENQYDHSMSVIQDGIATRSDIEKALWQWSGWQADQRGVDALLSLIDRYAATGRGPVLTVDGVVATADEILACARHEADQIVQSARDEAAVIQQAVQRAAGQPPADLRARPADDVAFTAYQAPDGSVWVNLGISPSAPEELDPGMQRCTNCRFARKLAMFRTDKSVKSGRRSLCRDCENAARRFRTAQKRKG